MAIPPKVMLIDDNEQLLNVMSNALTKLASYQVITVPNGIDGLEMIVSEHPDCVVIDVMMPGLNGFQLVRAIRGDPDTTNIPLILLTALVQETDQYVGQASGADYYLMKPVKPMDVIAVIDQALNISREERQQQLQVILQQKPPTSEN
jgi:twitching motility two-component system response regulator PilH